MIFFWGSCEILRIIGEVAGFSGEFRDGDAGFSDDFLGGVADFSEEFGDGVADFSEEFLSEVVDFRGIFVRICDSFTIIVLDCPKVIPSM